MNGNLNLSRAIGDLKYKGNSELPPKDQIITAQPDVRKIALQVRRETGGSGAQGRPGEAEAGLQHPGSWQCAAQGYASGAVAAVEHARHPAG